MKSFDFDLQPELRVEVKPLVVPTRKRRRARAKTTTVGGRPARRDSGSSSVPVPFGSY